MILDDAEQRRVESGIMQRNSRNELKQRLGDHGLRSELKETSKLTPLQEKSGSSHLIKDWQESTFPSASQGELGIVGRLSQGCIDLYSILLEKVKKDSSFTQRESKIFERNYHILLLWADGHEVLSGQLDGVLQKSKDLQRTILLTLNSLSEVMYERLINFVIRSDKDIKAAILRHTSIAVLLEESRYVISGLQEDSDGNESDSDDSEYNYPNDSIRATAEDIKTYIQCLVDLSSSINCPAMDPEYRDQIPTLLTLEKRNAHDYYADLISNKFPQASPDLVDRLGKANWSRYQRIQAERIANASAEAQDISQFEAASVLAGSKFHDSGLGSSIPAQTTYAATILSYISSLTDGNRPQIPPLPEEARKGQPFDCDACGKKIRARNNREWKKHLYLDLRPYICLYQRCSYNSTAFLSRELWIDHIGLDHGLAPDWQSQQCPLCLEQTGSGKGSILIHLARHMEDIALASLPKGPDSEVNSENGSILLNAVRYSIFNINMRAY